MAHLKLAFVILAAAAFAVNAKPSHPYGLHAIPDHFDFAPPVLPATHFHEAAHFHDAVSPLFTAPGHLLPAPAPLLPAPAPLLPAPAPFLPAHAHLLPAPAPVLPVPAAVLPALAPAPVLPAAVWPEPAFAAAPVVHTHVLPAPAAFPVAKVLPPILEPVAFAAPSYRAVLGPKTTTHHVSVGFVQPPTPVFAKLVAPHEHLHAAPLTLAHKLHHHHHHTLF